MLALIALCVAVAGLFLLNFRRKAATSGRRFPPGPPGWPVVGNMFDLGPQAHANLAGLKHKYGPLIWIRLGSVNTLVVASSEASMDLFKNHDHSFSNRHLNEAMKSDDTFSATVALSQYGPYWRMLRRLHTTELFSGKRINDTAPLRRRCVDKMIKWISDEANGTSLELRPFVLATLFNLIGNLVFSRDLVDPNSTKGNEFFELSSELTELTATLNLADFFPSLRWLDPQGVKKKVKIKLDLILDIIGTLVDKRRLGVDVKQQSNKDKDFLDVLLEFEGNGKDEPAKISDRNLCMLILELLMAGTESTVAAIEWAMAELLRKPEAMKKVRAEIAQVVDNERRIEESNIDDLHYLRAVIKETLRLHSSPFLVPRSVVKDIEFMGYWIPKDTQVFVLAWGLGRDPTNWDDPVSFKPERFLNSNTDYRGQNYEFLPFGAGRRICPGLPLALKMLHLVLGSLLQSFEWVLENSVAPETMDMTEKLGATLRKASPLKAIPRALM